MTDVLPPALPTGDSAWCAKLICFATEKSGLNCAPVAQVIETCTAEVAVGRALIEKYLQLGMRILVRAFVGGELPMLNRQASGLDIEVDGTLDFEADGTFDLIYSVNVLEHIPDRVFRRAGAGAAT
jgi:hypothetical protein